ncbi:helix-turn-helix domain-containing protein [Bifidobacterium sp. ESL0704]|uniref:helix-turn-helix domain-containing protein n=1 Tax=Bifidobacterium sp. ESL0704 TaxID=2983219 RepID=UPI0023F7C996|nr:helix-turn-helix domain-containing protein [Bifidobacterium sp. ESL0704]WEV52233.1 helix-turn-helix domain-containing protein [Bifidobacterium sp. ESL0704]
MEADREVSDASRTIGTGEAARILGVSRKTVQRMLDADAIPYRRNGEGGNRMMRQADVISYAETMQSERRTALDDLRDQAEDMGLYDNNPETVTDTIHRMVQRKKHPPRTIREQYQGLRNARLSTSTKRLKNHR